MSTRSRHRSQCAVPEHPQPGAGGALPAAALIVCVLGTAAGIAQAPAMPQVELVAPPAFSFNDIACAPFTTTAAPTQTLRILGSQDTVVKTMFGPGDTLVVSGGSAEGLKPGQEFYVRRLDRPLGERGPSREHPLGVHTAGWIRIAAAEATVATATIVHACDGILPDDYLEPFVPPRVAARSVPAGNVNYERTGRVVGGDEGRRSGAAGDLMTIDLGSDQGIVPGLRFLVFRDKSYMVTREDRRSDAFRNNQKSLPMVEVGEVVVISVHPGVSTVRVAQARDALQAGDLVAPMH